MLLVTIKRYQEWRIKTGYYQSHWRMYIYTIKLLLERCICIGYVLVSLSSPDWAPDSHEFCLLVSKEYRVGSGCSMVKSNSSSWFPIVEDSIRFYFCGQPSALVSICITWHPSLGVGGFPRSIGYWISESSVLSRNKWNHFYYDLKIWIIIPTSKTLLLLDSK